MFESSPDPAALVAVIESTHREESMLVARRFAAVAALLRHRVATTDRPEPEYAEIDGFEQTAAEVAAAMNLSAAAASYLVSYAETLDTRLPEVAALLAEGRTDWRTVRLIITRTSLVTDTELIAKLDRSLAARIGNWHGWSRQRIVNAVDAAVRTADPDAARERRLAAEEDRHIGISAAENGMAEVHGSVAAAAATAFDRRLSQLAKQVCPADPRTLDQRRADALAALAEGRRLPCACGQPDCPARTGDQNADDRTGWSSTWWPATEPSTPMAPSRATWKATASSTPTRCADWRRPRTCSSPIPRPARRRPCATSRRRRWSGPFGAGISPAASPDAAVRR